MWPIVCRCLLNRFYNLFREVAEDPIKLPFHSQFQSIHTKVVRLEEKYLKLRSPVDILSIRGALTDLIDALSECRLFAHELHLASKKRFFYLFLPSKIWFRGAMKIRLSLIEDKIRLSRPTAFRISTSDVHSWLKDTRPVKDASKIYGLDELSGRIVKMVADETETGGERFAAVGIAGMGGSGKTSLAQKVFSDLSPHFEIKIWLCLSDTLLYDIWEKSPFLKRDTRRIWRRQSMLKGLMETLNIESAELESQLPVVELLGILKERLEGKKYLIVLDNISDVDGDWYADLSYNHPEGENIGEKLSHGLPKGSGGVVIVTSRMEHEVNLMVGANNTIVLDSLPGEVCWSIFVRSLDKKELKPEQRELVPKLKGDIIENCDGLPLVAKALAEIVHAEIRKL